MKRITAVGFFCILFSSACSGPVAEESFDRVQMGEIFADNIVGAFEQEVADSPDWSRESFDGAVREVKRFVESAPEFPDAVEEMMRMQELYTRGRLSHAETEKGVNQLTKAFVATHGVELYAIAERHREPVVPPPIRSPQIEGKQPDAKMQPGSSIYTAEQMRQSSLWAPPAPAPRTVRPQDPVEPKSELLQLQETMESAVTQSDLNAASHSLAAYWDRQLMEAEESAVAELTDSEAVELFWAARRAWKAWREAEVTLHGDAVRGGTARPMIENLAWADLTEKRVVGLRRIYGDDGSAGTDR